MNWKRLVWVAVWAVLVVVTGYLAFGAGPGSLGYGPWQGWGRMMGWNGDTRAVGALGGYGIGPGMMGGAGQGWGTDMMPFGLLGNGVSAGGYATPSGPLSGLAPEQAEKIRRIQRDAESRHSQLLQQLWAAQDKLNLLRMSGTPDWNAIRAASHALFDLQRRQLDAAIDLQQQVDGVLTDQQRQDLARTSRGDAWMGAQ